jgi:hypothetical protein
VGNAGHDVARQYVQQQMTALGLESFRGASLELPYCSGEQHFTNLVGRIPGRDPSARPVLIGAHYDSVIDAPCADDNAAAVAIALEAVRTLSSTPLHADLILAVFDAEEPPYFLSADMGSTRFYKEHCTGVDFGCAIIMDLVGHDVEARRPRDEGAKEPDLDRLIPHLKDFLFITGSESHPTLPLAVRQAAENLSRLRVIPTLNKYVGDMSDHHAFRLGEQPFLFLSCGQGRHYHTREDTVEWLNFDKILQVHELVVGLIRRLQNVPHGPRGQVDTVDFTVDFEIEMIERASGLTRAQLAKGLEIDRLETREDLTQLALVLQDLLLVWGLPPFNSLSAE